MRAPVAAAKAATEPPRFDHPVNSGLVSEPLEPVPSTVSEEGVAAAVAAATTALASATDSAGLKAAKSEHLGEHSAIAAFNAAIKGLPGNEKAAAGKLVGQARARLSQAFDARQAQVAVAEETERLAAESVDVTALPTRWTAGARHPLNLLMDQIGDIFVGMGWEISEGPELENEWFNFDSMNFDEDHPARAMQDTFFVEPVSDHLVLRTHTSPVQTRSMLDRTPPIYVIAPGKTFRTDELDATHTPVFHQVEGLAVDRGLTMAHLRGTLEHFARLMFGDEAKIRLRPNYFPFTEPSAEMDVWQPNAKGGARWVEWGGCGMINRNVLLASGIDPDVYQGFAFGVGVERTLQFRNELNDMRDMVEGDIRFSKQFGMVI